ncbi:HAD family hydrolase [Saccharothrix coeruleofusca]|uniref:Haloacid dehalogenase n=1 Tax=Saccharothrix coeruleofusca TaxID=33919 RepID=A0A918EGB6_9PSEU|nr:HAD family phosphatase [Saccharothrix coeruleofusca]MBP2339712.1 putative hydrolase of the HAD superfamily [Saccharothrix coeruleofusca]GGP80681.1 haloacid dehalogenase [Saccharothrix coeruleofusca]
MRWIVFDYGEVISKPTEALPTLAGLLGVTAEALSPAYWAHRHSYDLGLPDAEYWRVVAADAGSAVPVDEELAARLTEVDVAGWMHPEPATLALLAELDEAGVPLALLSNAPSSFGRVAERQAWTRHFRHLVFSGDLGVGKPDERIWRELARRLDARPEDCVFLDDRQVNVDGAVAAGMAGVLWRGSAPARDELVRLSVLGG